MRNLAIARSVLAALFLFAAACADDPVSVAPVEPPNFAKTAAVEPMDHHVVNGIPSDLAERVEALGGSVMRTHPEIGIAVVGGLTDEAADELAASDDISDVTRDISVQWIPDFDDMEAIDAPEAEGHVGGHDPTTAFWFPCQWNMTQANCPAAWAQGEFGNPNVKVAVLDTGVDPFHLDLAGRIDVGNSVSMLSSPSACDGVAPDVGTFFDFNFHGSFVSGIIAGNGIRVTGVAPQTTIVGVKVLNCLGSGSFADIIAGILYAANLPVDVINMSLGVPGGFPKNVPGGGQLVAALNKAVNHAGSKGVLVVSSAGNDATNMDKDGNRAFVPAQSGSGIAIWAGDIDGNLASYSNFGRSGTLVGAGGGDNTPGSPNIPLPGCLLPAFGHDGIVSVCSTFSLFFGCGPANVLFNGTGTSFSAPLVSGVAALVDGKYGGSKNAGQLKTILKNSADDLGKKGTDGIYSHGRVNAGNAVQ
jgi:subtilisin family serine protease